jgi:uncharacterized protein YcaQ
LLSPFDNLICDRERTERLGGFVYRNEMYVPKYKRPFGCYVMPGRRGSLLRPGRVRRILTVGESAGRSRRAQAR